jgi:hypothetical protein
MEFGLAGGLLDTWAHISWLHFTEVCNALGLSGYYGIHVTEVVLGRKWTFRDFMKNWFSNDNELVIIIISNADKIAMAVLGLHIYY